jgi:hypothetical protein
MIHLANLVDIKIGEMMIGQYIRALESKTSSQWLEFSLELLSNSKRVQYLSYEQQFLLVKEINSIPFLIIEFNSFYEYNHAGFKNLIFHW